MAGGKGKILIAAGGTGGHIFPALAFGRWLLDQNKAEEVFYLSGSRPLEKEIYGSQGVKPYALRLSGSPAGASFFRGLRRWAELVFTFFQTGFLLGRKRPDLCFLFGGYISLAPLIWCRILGIPAAAHEQNTFAGKVTRLASRWGVPVASGWDVCSGVEAFTPVGVPVRPFERISRQEAASVLGIEGSVEEGDFVVGVAGGSLSSAFLNSLAGKLSRILCRPGPGKRCLFVVLADPAQDGSALRTEVHFVGRRWDMAPFYSLCDAVICRAGASTLAELAVYGIPALAIPWKEAADGHQEGNARCFSALTGSLWTQEDGLGKIFPEFLERCEKNDKKQIQQTQQETASDACAALWEFGRANTGTRKKK